MIENPNASCWPLRDSQVKEILPGQHLVQRKINEGERVVLKMFCRRPRWSWGIGKQISHGDVQRFNNPVEGTASQTVEQDVPFVGESYSETRFPIIMGWTAGHPATQRFTNSLQTS